MAVFLFTVSLINLSFIYIRILILAFSLISFSALGTFITVNKIFKKILLETYDNQCPDGLRLGLRSKIYFQLLPVFIVALIFVSMIGYSRIVAEKGDLCYELYKSILDNKFDNIGQISNLEQVKEILYSIELKGAKDCTFIITPDSSIITSNGSNFSTIYRYFINKLKPSYTGRIYDMTCEIQGVIKKISISNKDWVVGIKFEVASKEAISFFVIGFIILLILNFLVLYYISKSLVSDISIVAKSLVEIAEGDEVNLDKKIPITSNDEIADLIVAFHKIQELEKSNIKSIKEKQAIIMEKERLASLGHMIGGITHNLNSPIMTISVITGILKDLVKEYSDSIGDKNVTEEDHKEIAEEMMSNLEKIGPQCAFMSNIINTMKLQAVKLNESTNDNFYLDELVKIINLLIHYKQKIHNCIVNIQINIDDNPKILGEINNIAQVIDNLILNAMESYGESGGTIDVTVLKEGKNIKLAIKDYGKGIPHDIRDRIFKQMVTTKGKHGTGVGLYMSYSTVKGRFGGDMWFESTEGKGTTFYITIPYMD
jgi:signal transduction histidine kinase